MSSVSYAAVLHEASQSIEDGREDYSCLAINEAEEALTGAEYCFAKEVRNWYVKLFGEPNGWRSEWFFVNAVVETAARDIGMPAVEFRLMLLAMAHAVAEDEALYVS